MTDTTSAGTAHTPIPQGLQMWLEEVRRRPLMTEMQIAESFYEAQRLREQRDELLTALRELLDARGTGMDIVGHHPVDGHPLSREGVAAVNARALIARVTGA